MTLYTIIVLNTIYKDKFDKLFCCLASYYFFQDKPKFLSLMDDGQCQSEGMKKCSTGLNNTSCWEQEG